MNWDKNLKSISRHRVSLGEKDKFDYETQDEPIIDGTGNCKMEFFCHLWLTLSCQLQIQTVNFVSEIIGSKSVWNIGQFCKFSICKIYQKVSDLFRKITEFHAAFKRLKLPFLTY